MASNVNLDSIKELGKKRVRITFKNLPYLIIIAFTVILTGLTELIKPDFTWEVFTTSSYWFNVVLVSASGLLMAIASTLRRSNIIMLEDADNKFSECNKALAKISPNIQDSSLDKFLYETNKKRKQDTYRRKIERKLYKLEQKAKAQDISTYVEFSKKHVFDKKPTDFETEEEYFTQYCLFMRMSLKGQNKFVRKKVGYLLEVHPLNLTYNIDKINIKYRKITHKLITVGSQGNVNDDLPNSSLKVLTNGLLPRSLFTFSVSTMMLSFSFDIAKLSWLCLVPILVKLLSLTSNFVYGYQFAPSYVEQVPLDALYVKIRWLTLFNEWKTKNKDPE